MAAQILAFFADDFIQPILYMWIIDVIIVDPSFISRVVRWIDIYAFYTAFVLRQETFQCEQIISVDDHILTAVILFMLTFFIKAVFTFKNAVWHIQMMIHDLALAYPIQCWHILFLLLIHSVSISGPGFLFFISNACETPVFKF